MVRKSLKKGFHALALVTLAACVDGDNPAGVGPTSVSIAALPNFAVVPTDEEWAVLDSLRVTLRNVGDTSIVADTAYSVNPSDDEWVIEFTLELAEDQVLSLTLDIEFFDIDLGYKSVEFSGRTEEPFDVQASFEPKEVRQINLYRGPLVNLDLTSLVFVDGTPRRLQEGGSTALQLLTQGSAPGQIIYFRSADPGVASVDSLGNIAALVPGTTMITVLAGRESDEFELEVRQVNLPGPQQLQANVLPQIDYVTEDQFMSTFADPVAMLAIKNALGALSIEMLAGQGFESVGKFEDVEEVWNSYGRDSDLRLLDRPQLGVITLALIRAADVLGIDFLIGN